MLRMPLTPRGKNRAGIGTTLALALTLASGAVVGTVALTGPAYAQEQPAIKPSRDFGQVYQPLATIANDAAGDFASARSQLPALVAAVENEDDRYLAGHLHFALGLKLKDQALQKQGMELMLASRKAPPAAVAEMNYFLGEWAYDAQDWARARQYFQAARAAGYTEGNAEGLTAASYFKEGQLQQGLAYLESLIEQRRAAGQQAPEVWLLRGLAVSYEARDAAQAGKWSALLAAEYPTAENWRRAWLVVDQLQSPDPKANLDLLRLMALTNSLTDRASFARYLEAVDPRIMATEAGRVLAAARTAGAFTEADPDYARIKAIVDERAPGEPAEAAGYAREAAAASNARPAENAGDLYLALEDFVKAEAMFQLALTKSGVDRDAVLTRLGIAQAQQGKYAEAKATFAQVSGTRASIAQLWTAYVDSKA
jgi:hypothetical protein